MMQSPEPDKADFEKLTILLMEYTEKLRRVCEAKSRARFRQLQLSAIIMSTFAALISFAFIFNEKSKILEITSIIPVAVSVMVCFYVFFQTYSRSGVSFDAHHLAATVERLIRLASQYNEHASRRIGDRFELDLRIGEAEGALRLYQRLFNTTEGSQDSGSNKKPSN